MLEKIKRYSAPLFFVAVFFIYFLSRVSYITDSRWTLQTSWAIIHQHNTRLDTFRPFIEQSKNYGIDSVNGHLYYYFPPGTPLLCSPFFLLMEQTGKRVFYFNVINLLQGPYEGGMDTFLAALFTTLSVIFLWLVLKQWQIQNWLAGLLVFVFAFGTSAWSAASRGLFAHGPSMLFLIAGIWALNKASTKNSWLWLAGFLFSYAYVIRPTNAIPLALFTGYVLWQYRFASWRFLCSALPVLLLFFVYNRSVYGHLLSPYYNPSHIGEQHQFFDGLVTALFSPNRGLFIYSPFLIMLIPALYFAFKKKMLRPLPVVILAIILLHTILIARFDVRYSGWCFGARYFSDIMPFFILLLAVGLQATLSYATGVRRMMLGIFILLAAASCWINAQGANNQKTFEWNYTPNNIDEHRERVWDWNDIQFLR